MTGKHARRQGHHSRYSRGPDRWARAALNAVRNPHSAAATLYFNRVAVAREISQSTELVTNVRTPWEFTGTVFKLSYDSMTGARSVKRRSGQRLYVTCSLHCTIMQLTLDYSTTDKEKLGSAFRPDPEPERAWYTVKVRPLATKANRRCEVCGRQVVVK